MQSAVDAIAKSKWQLGPQETEEIFAKGAGVMTPADAGTFGNMPRNLFRGPGLEAWDLSGVRGWRITEKAKLQFRGSSSTCSTIRTSPTRYGAKFHRGPGRPLKPRAVRLCLCNARRADANPVIGTGGPRNIQLGIKAVF